MPWKDNFDLFQLFITKTVHVWEEDSDNDATKAAFDIVLPTIKQFYEREDISLTYNFCTMSESKLAQFNPIIAAKNGDVKHCSFFNLLTGLVFDFGMFKEYMQFVGMLRSGLKSIIPSIVFDNNSHSITVGNHIPLNTEICDYLTYLLKLSCGEKMEKPLQIHSEAERQFYLAQKENEDKIAKLRQQSQKTKDGLLKSFLFIEYVFPSYTHDYLLNQTMAQIHWLQNYAAGAVSYEVNAKAFAAGNMKKGSKLDFFIK